MSRVSLGRVPACLWGACPDARPDVALGTCLPVSLLLAQALAMPLAGAPGSQWMSSQLHYPIYSVLLTQE